MADIPITVVGNIATDLHSTMTKGGPVATFRLASNLRRWDRNRGWYDAGTSFFTVTCWRQLAENAVSSLVKGQPVVVSGRMQVRPWKTEDGREGTTVDIEASAVGHDLSWGTSAFRKTEVQQMDTVDRSQLDQLHRLIEAEEADADLDGADLDDPGSVGVGPTTQTPAGEGSTTRTGSPGPDRTTRKATAGSDQSTGEPAPLGTPAGSSGAKAGERAA